MKIKVFNQNKEAVKEIELPKEIFKIEANSDLIHQVVLVQRANRRQKIAKVKDRSEVRGGGKNLGGKKEPEGPDTVQSVLLYGKAEE